MPLLAPVVEDLRFDFRKLAAFGWFDVRHADKMKTVGRFNRAMPRAGLEGENCACKLLSELAGHGLLISVVYLGVKHQGVAHVRGAGDRWRVA